MAPETLDTIVDFLANGDFCAQNGDERCPAAVDGVIRQGLPMIAAAGADAGYAEVRKQNICPFDLGQLINYQGKWEKALFFSLLQRNKL